MSARRGHLAAVPGVGERGPDEEVSERPRVLAAVGICQQDGCEALVRKPVMTHYGLLVFEAEPVRLTEALVEAGAAYLLWRGANDEALIVRADGLPREAYADVETALTPHVCTSILETQGASA